jgi:hypothetical protein
MLAFAMLAAIRHHANQSPPLKTRRQISKLHHLYRT